jgi:hypothetical protein
MSSLCCCAQNVYVWCTSRRLQLNGDKYEIAQFGTRANLKNISCSVQSLAIGSNTVQPLGAVQHLGVWLDSELTLWQYVMTIAGACFYFLC